MLQPLAQLKAFHSFLRTLFRHDWVVYAKPPFGGPDHMLHYLARYTHRVAISNHRLVSFAEGKVTSRWKDYAHQCPNLVIVVDDLQVSPVGLPSLADLVEREFSNPDHDPDDPDDIFTYERLGVLFLHPEYENYKTIHYRTDFVQNAEALPRCALPPPVSDLLSRMREENRLRVERKWADVPSLFDILRRKQLTRPHLVFEAFGEALLLSKAVIPQPNRLGGFPMDSFAEQHWPVKGRQFQSRTGIWICDLTGPVDVSGVDR